MKLRFTIMFLISFMSKIKKVRSEYSEAKYWWVSLKVVAMQLGYSYFCICCSLETPISTLQCPIAGGLGKVIKCSSVPILKNLIVPLVHPAIIQFVERVKEKAFSALRSTHWQILCFYPKTQRIPSKVKDTTFPDFAAISIKVFS